jgi:hypothetical protein
MPDGTVMKGVKHKWKRLKAASTHPVISIKNGLEHTKNP